jgi:hypothetical protein
MTETWKSYIKKEMRKHREKIADIVEMSVEKQRQWTSDPSTPILGREWMDVEHQNEYALVRAASFTIWTSKRVYFPAGYDGNVSVASVSRDPDGMPTPYVGGGCE